eukprot:gene22490-29616_t
MGPPKASDEAEAKPEKDVAEGIATVLDIHIDLIKPIRFGSLLITAVFLEEEKPATPPNPSAIPVKNRGNRRDWLGASSHVPSGDERGVKNRGNRKDWIGASSCASSGDERGGTRLQQPRNPRGKDLGSLNLGDTCRDALGLHTEATAAFVQT